MSCVKFGKDEMMTMTIVIAKKKIVGFIFIVCVRDSRAFTKI